MLSPGARFGPSTRLPVSSAPAGGARSTAPAIPAWIATSQSKSCRPSSRTIPSAGALPVKKSIDIAVQIARGLAATHAKGFVGTVGYMAPEQVRGLSTDARTDLFALGAVLYEMLSGQRAFQRDTAPETMTAILREDPVDLASTRADLSPTLDRVVRHCLEKNPNERFQTARDVAFALEPFSGSRVVPAAAWCRWCSSMTSVLAVVSAKACRSGAESCRCHGFRRATC